MKFSVFTLLLTLMKMIPIHAFKGTIANAPAGYCGFYTLGISSYIKRNYDTSCHHLSGASAGSGNSIYLSFNGDDCDYIDGMLDRVDSMGKPTLARILQEVCDYHTEKYTTDDFDLDRVSIGVTHLTPFGKQCELHYQFDSLHDAVACSKASSNIPFISGSPLNIYRNDLTYDGAFCHYPKVESEDFLVEPWMWREAEQRKLLGFIPVPREWGQIYEGLFGSRRYKARELYEMGWKDAQLHKSELDAYFDAESLDAYFETD